jgi:type 1 fimbria pilin
MKKTKTTVAHCAVLFALFATGTIDASLPSALNDSLWSESNSVGSLMESSCYLEMNSAWQSVNLNASGVSRVLYATEQGAPVPFGITLRDCFRNSRQPYASLSLVAPLDHDSPQLVKVNGASGLGLRVRDANGALVNMHNSATPLNFMSGQNSLNFTVTPERTNAALGYGLYNAQMDFRLNYE